MKIVNVCKCIFITLIVVSVKTQAGLLPNRLVDGHTAGSLPRGHYATELLVYSANPYDGHGSGLIAGLQVGISNRFSIGLAYGGEGIIGYSDHVRGYPLSGIGAMVKYRLFDEGYAMPAITLGFDNQGYGGLANVSAYDYSGYVFKSPGFFAVASKNFIMLEKVQLGFHGSLNYSLEDTENVTWPNLLAGMDIVINDELSFVAEYNFAFDDITGAGDNQNYGRMFQGFFNLGLRWAFSPNFQLQFNARDVNENKTRRTGRYNDDGEPIRHSIGWSRELKIIYIAEI